MKRFLRLKALLLAALIVISTLAVLPSVASIAKFDLPTWITSNFTNQFTLGLDLQGGLHLEYSVAVDEALENKIDQVASELEGQFKDKKNVLVTSLREGKDRIQITFKSVEDKKTATDDVLGVAFAEFERKTDEETDTTIVFKMRDEKIAEAKKESVSQAINTVTNRIDAMGIAEPSIYPKNNQVVIELPGLDNEATAITTSRQDAALALETLLRKSGAEQVTIAEVPLRSEAFRITVPGKNMREFLAQTLGGSLKTLEAGQFINHDEIKLELEIEPPEAGVVESPDTVTVSLSQAARDKALEESSGFRRLLKLIERAAVLEMRMVDDEFKLPGKDAIYLKSIYDANLVRQGMGITVAKERDYGHEDGVTVKSPFGFYAKDRETLERFFNNLPAEWRLPPSHMVAYGTMPMQLRKDGEPEQIWRTYVVKTRAEVTGERILNANVEPDPQTGVPGVSLNLDRIGADAFEKMSGDNVGRKMAIMLDDRVSSDPIFNSRIPGGRVRITMGETPGMTVREAANDLVKVLKSGSLPARLVKEFEIRVGADLGADSVRRGFWALVVGLALVVSFTAIYYRRAGLVAVFALILNVLLVMAAMAFFQATLTLPGIAGLVLTIGMAVDANVIIFERVREFIREGYTARAAIEAGYDRAFTTILDSQLTTAIAGIVLWQFGSGPIRGFAITLLIGITTSIFTAVFCTRLFFDFQANRRGFDRVSI
ncbi:MAG: protein translocase subunit SecD [Myxococcales bacterium]|nr:protein translocase subunit SecD [Myxococcales bacterium]